jgi:hypothetical protein
MDADGWDRRYAGAALIWSAGPNRFVEKELADLPPGRVLDLASGEGRNALWLAALGWQATAVDCVAPAIVRPVPRSFLPGGRWRFVLCLLWMLGGRVGSSF